MDQKKPKTTAPGSKPAAPNAASQIPTFTGDVNTSKKDGYDERAQIVFVHPLSPTITKLLKYLNNDKTVKISEASSTQEGMQLAQTVKPCILVASIQQNNDIMKLLQLAAMLKADIKSGRIKTVISSTVKQPAVIKKFEDYGCHEYMIEPINDRQLQFKMSLQIKANKAARKKQKSIEVKQLGGGAKSEKQTDEDIKLKNSKTEGKTTESTSPSASDKNKNEATNPQVRELPPNEISEDTWVFKNKPSRKGTKWAFRVDGPDPTEGSWQRLTETTPDGDVQWRYMPKGQDSGKKSGWHFTGEKPQFDGNGWNFESKRPNLVYMDEIGKILASKVAVDEDGNVTAAADSKIALEKIAKKEAELQKKKLEKKAAFFSRKPGNEAAEDAKNAGSAHTTGQSETKDDDGDEESARETNHALAQTKKAYGKGNRINDQKSEAAELDNTDGAIRPDGHDENNSYGAKSGSEARKNGHDTEDDDVRKKANETEDGDEGDGSSKDRQKVDRGLTEGLDLEEDKGSKAPEGQNQKAYGKKKPVASNKGPEQNHNESLKGAENSEEETNEQDNEDAGTSLANKNFLKKKKNLDSDDDSQEQDERSSQKNLQEKALEAADRQGKTAQSKDNLHGNKASKNAAPAERSNKNHENNGNGPLSRESDESDHNHSGENPEQDSDGDEPQELTNRNFLKKKKPAGHAAAEAPGENHGSVTKEAHNLKKRKHINEDESSSGGNDGAGGDSDNTQSQSHNESAGEKRPESQYFEFLLDHFGSANGTWETAGYQEIHGVKTKVLVFVFPELKMKQVKDVRSLDPYWICFENRPIYQAKQKLWIFRDRPPAEVSSFDLLFPIVQQFLLTMESSTATKTITNPAKDKKKPNPKKVDGSSVEDLGDSEAGHRSGRTDSKKRNQDESNSNSQLKKDTEQNSESKGDLEFEAEQAHAEHPEEGFLSEDVNEAINSSEKKNNEQGDAAWSEDENNDGVQDSELELGDEEKTAAAIELEINAETQSENASEGAPDDSDANSEIRDDDKDQAGVISDASDAAVIALDSIKHESQTTDINFGTERVEPLVFMLRMAEMQMSRKETMDTSFKAFFDMMQLAFNLSSITVVCVYPGGQTKVAASRNGPDPGTNFELKSRALTAFPHQDGEVRTESGLKRVKAFCCPLFEGPILLGFVVIEQVDILPEELPKDLSYIKVVCRSLRGMLLTLRSKDQNLPLNQSQAA